jgi:hypothetical protein
LLLQLALEDLDRFRRELRGERWHFILRNGMFDFLPEHRE